MALRAAAGGLLGVLALGTAGCSVKGAQNANVIMGKQQFVAKCGSCHTLARAGTKGIIGPNLDTAFAASIAAGLRRSTIRGVVEGQVKIPNPEGAMPKDLVSGATLTDVAAYVSQAADRPGQDTGLLASAVPVAGAGKPAVEKAGKLQIAANPTGQLAYVTNKASATAGAVTVEMPNAIRRLAQHRDPTGHERRGARRERLHREGHDLGDRQPQTGHLHVLLPGSRTPSGRDARHADGQVSARTSTIRPTITAIAAIA